MWKEGLGLVAILMTFVAFYPYIRSIRGGETRPHVFSWVIWGAVTFAVFIAQMADGGGAGAWPIGISGLITFYVAYLAFQMRGEVHITRSDWVFFALASTALPLWFFTQNPLWAVVVLTTVDILGFAPTFRKAWVTPMSENITTYAIMAGRNGVSILALQNYTLTTVLFPAVVGLACFIFVIMVLVRRRALKVGLQH